MGEHELFDQVYGCMVGNAIGDAYGAVIEFADAETVDRIVDGDWLADFLPYDASFPRPHQLGVWEPAPPRGTGTDDTRNNHVFIECVIRNQGFINSHLLAIDYIERHRDAARFYPLHPEMASKQFRYHYLRACAYLGMREMPAGEDAWIVNATGNSPASLVGLINIAFVGLLHPGEPEQAYHKAFELSFLDTGYARDATAMLAAMISAGVGGNLDADGMIKAGLETDPFAYGGGRIMARKIRQFMELADAAESERELVDALAREVTPLHPFDTIDILGVPIAALHFAGGDPAATLRITANTRDVDADGALVRMRDVDCSAGVAGALLGALHGISAFPDDWVEDVLSANRLVNEVDILKNARDFVSTVYGT